ncbi:MAG: ArsR/SmtB family transcription factor [Phenylobacterium sp.]
MLDETLQALADPTRRAILARLMDGEARVTDVAQPFAISLNSVSKHIRVLERAALVSRRREGREHILALNPGALDEAARWIDAQRSLWSWRLGRLDAALTDKEPEPWTAKSPSASPAASPPPPSALSTPGWTRPSPASFSSPRRPGR